MQEVEAVCDRVIIINKGVIVADDKLNSLQQQKKGGSVVVQFKEALEPEWLQRLPGVAAATKNSDGRWRLQTENEEEVRKAVLGLALEHNLNIISLQNEGSSLEDVFRNLTAAKD